MAKKKAGARLVNLDDTQVLYVLTRLAYDDRFRKSFESNPAGVLGRIGLEVDPEAMLDYKKKGVNLPTKTEIRKRLGNYIKKGQANSLGQDPRVFVCS